MTGCMCNCSVQNQQLFNSTEELYQKIEELVKFIKVEKISTNAFMRGKISVRDYRPSSVRIGYICGYGIIISLTSLLVMSDVQVLCRHIRFGAVWRRRGSDFIQTVFRVLSNWMKLFCVIKWDTYPWKWPKKILKKGLKQNMSTFIDVQVHVHVQICRKFWWWILRVWPLF